MSCCVVLCYFNYFDIINFYRKYFITIILCINYFFYKNYLNFLIFLVFRDAPGCSSMFRVPGFIDVPNIQLSELFKVIRKKNQDQSENVSYIFTSDHSYLKQHDFMLFVFNFWSHEIWRVSETNIRENWNFLLTLFCIWKTYCEALWII